MTKLAGIIMDVNTTSFLFQRVVEFLAPYEEKTLLTFYKYFIVDVTLRRNGQQEKYCSKERLLELVNTRISRFSSGKGIASRRLRYLLLEMEELFDAPIAHKKGAGRGYYYASPDYSLSKAILEKQKQQLFPGSEILVTMLNFLNQFNEVIPNVPDYEKLTAQITGQSTVTHQIIQMDVNRKVEGLEWIKTCYDAILEQQPLSISYKPYGKERRNLTLHPYQLREWRQRWFVWGWNHSLNKVSILALDRIWEIAPTNLVKFDVTQRDFFLTRFNSIVGITFPEDETLQPGPVRVCVSRLMANYLASKPVHPSQERLETDENGNVFFAFNVISNFEFEQWILGMGEEIRVMEPFSLVHRIQQRIQRMASVYLNPAYDEIRQR